MKHKLKLFNINLKKRVAFMTNIPTSKISFGTVQYSIDLELSVL